MRITVLAGGVGGARYLLGVREWVRRRGADDRITAIVNVGDDWWHDGLRICPDLDSTLYALAGVNDTERGWGRAGDTERISAELAAWGLGAPWFTLGDLDVATSLARTAWLREGATLTEVTARLAARWDPGVTLLPASDDEVETWVATAQGELHFQEWWTRHRARLPAERFVQRGLAAARPTPQVLEALARADLVLLAPSNPVVSIGTSLAIPALREALVTAPAPVVGVSPIIGGAVVRGMADACLAAIGVATDAAAVAEHYGARTAGGVLDGWLVDEVDAGVVPGLSTAGIAAAAVPLWMRTPEVTAEIVGASVRIAGL